MRKGWIVCLLVPPVVCLGGGCAGRNPVKPSAKSAARPRPKRDVRRSTQPAVRLPRWYNLGLLGRSLARTSAFSLHGIWSMRLCYRQRGDALVHYLDVQSRQGRLESVAVRSTAPVPVGPLVSADWRGRWVMVQTAQAHPHWPVAPHRDLSAVWRVLNVPRVLSQLTRQQGRPARVSPQRVRVNYDRHQLVLGKAGLVSLRERGPGKPTVQISRDGRTLRLRSGGTRAVLERVGSSWTVGEIQFVPAGIEGGTARISSWRRAGTPGAEKDPYRDALAAYHAARERGVERPLAMRRLVSVFGKWAEQEMIK